MNVFADLSWSDITATNKDLCKARGAQHGLTSEGHEPAVKIFDEAKDRDALDLADAVELLRGLHKTAPFLFYNGNTFAQIGADLAVSFSAKRFDPALRSLVGISRERN